MRFPVTRPEALLIVAFLLAAGVGTAWTIWAGRPVPVESRSTSPVIERHSIPSPTQTVSSQLNVNEAGPEALCQLPGIGPVIAKNIVAHREKNGPFLSPEELLNVDKIGPKTLEKIRGLITCGEAAAERGKQ